MNPCDELPGGRGISVTPLCRWHWKGESLRGLPSSGQPGWGPERGGLEVMLPRLLSAPEPQE